jgi:lipid-A-disaccharide synthase
MSAVRSIAMVAGEVSGDLLAAPVVRELRSRDPALSLVGIGGDRMSAEGFDAWGHVRELSLRGYVEVIRHLPRVFYLRTRLIRRLHELAPSVFVGVDAPDFNLGLEEKLRAAGMRTVQFVSPAIWAWRPERIEQVRRAVDTMLLVFPFEQQIYETAGIRASYVGHPLASMIPSTPDAAAARLRLGLAASDPVIAVLPGSRPDEVRYLAPTFAQAVERIAAAQPHVRFLVPAADAALRKRLEAMPDLQRLGEQVIVTLGQSHDCLEACDVALVSSGTATLEAALFKRPMVISYRMPVLSAWIMRRKGTVAHIGLPNILAGERVVPELLQDDATPDALSRAVLALLHDDASRARIAQRFAEIHTALKRDTARLVADAILATAK